MRTLNRNQAGKDFMSFTASHLYFDDVHVGQEWQSLGRTVTEADIVNFAGLSGDFNPIHVDHEFCKSTVFRKPIAHGLLIFAMGSGLGLAFPPMRTLAFLAIKEWKFLEPVFIGDTIRVHAKLLEKEERSRGRRDHLAAPDHQPARQARRGRPNPHPRRRPREAAPRLAFAWRHANAKRRTKATNL